MNAIARAVYAYLFLLLVLRLIGRRAVMQNSPFEMILIFLFGGTMIQAVVGEDRSLTNALLAVMTIGLMHALVAYLKFRFTLVRKLVDRDRDERPWELERRGDAPLATADRRRDGGSTRERNRPSRGHRFRRVRAQRRTHGHAKTALGPGAAVIVAVGGPIRYKCVSPLKQFRQAAPTQSCPPPHQIAGAHRSPSSPNRGRSIAQTEHRQTLIPGGAPVLPRVAPRTPPVL